ncbi:MAG: ABC transporter permease [Pseudomonadales bacterium]|nr:ABC transporter permease [Pseudomonadales bacterium]
MFTNHLKIAIKDLSTNKLYSVINIAGLAISLAACIVIALYVQDETSYDKHWSNAERLFRVNRTELLDNSQRRYSSTSLILSPTLNRYFSGEIEYASRLMALNQDISFEDAQYSETVYAVDADLIEMMDFELLSGSLNNAIADVNSIALSDAFARTVFGDKDPIGETISLSSTGVVGLNKDYQVDAIYRLPPENSVLELPAITLFDMDDFPWGTDWGIISTHTYIQLNEGSDVESLSQRLPEFVNGNVVFREAQQTPGAGPSERMCLDLQNISEIYLNSPFDTSGNVGNKTAVIAFTIISILVLLIGSINFMVLTTARATQRSKEVVMRKIVGAQRRQLISQFLGESVFTVFLSILVALGILELLLPVLEPLTTKSLSIDYASPLSYLFILSLLLLVGSAGGIYPSIILSRFRPSGVLKTAPSSETRSSLRLRNLLVVFQFAVSIALIIATAVIFTQMRFLGDRDPGFNRENLIAINNLLFREEVRARKSALKEEVLALSSVSNATLSIHQPTQQLGLANNYMSYSIPGGPDTRYRIATLPIDEDFVETYEIGLLAGRSFSLERDSISVDNPGPLFVNRNVVLNESAVRELGLGSPGDAIGQQVLTLDSDNTLTISGVVNDTDFFNLRSVPRPEVYILNSGLTDVLTIRYEGDEQTAMAQITEVWNAVMGDEVLQSSSVEQLMAQEFTQEQIQANILTSFSLLAIVVACLGLFGSVSYSVDRRKREIGIRKILGAKIREIVMMLVWYFSKPVFVANVIAWPVAIWVMINWLEQFPYQIDRWLLLLVCLFAALAALMIAWLTVASKSFITALQNPIDSIRYE